MNNDFDVHSGPLLKGDLIVIEINGKLVPRSPNDKTAQAFMVINDQIGNEQIGLAPFNEVTKLHKPRKYVALWKL